MSKKFTTKSLVRVIALMVVALLTLTAAGCKKSPQYTSSFVYEDEYITVDGSKVEGTADGTTSGNGNKGGSTTTSGGTVSSTKTGKEEITLDSSLGKDPNANYDIKGTVTVAIDTARPTDYEALFDAFKQLYPNVTVKFDFFMHQGSDDNAAEYLSNRAATGNLPDIVFDEAGNLTLYASQGWLYPLDSFVANDSDFNDVPKNLLNDYTFNGKLYALPQKCEFEMLMLNTDIMDDLNISMPALDWNKNDFESFIKKGNTDKYSGIEELWDMPCRISTLFNSNSCWYGYNRSTKKYEMASSFSQALNFCRSLRAVSGLEAYWLRTTAANVENSDYAKKFGKDNLTETYKAFYSGKTLMHYIGTWQKASYKQSFKYNWEMWPYPQSSAGAMQYHVDHSFMLSSTKNPEATFALLRFVTYSKEGNIARLSMYDENNKGKYILNNELYYPATTNKAVAEKFYSLPSVGKVEKYMFDSIPNCNRADCFKFVPGFRDIHTQYISPSEDKVMDGVATADEIMPEAEQKANTALAEQWNTFNNKMKSVQAEFDASH